MNYESSMKIQNNPLYLLIKSIALANEIDPIDLSDAYGDLLILDPVQRGEALGAKQYYEDHPEEFGPNESYCSTRVLIELLAARMSK